MTRRNAPAICSFTSYSSAGHDAAFERVERERPARRAAGASPTVPRGGSRAIEVRAEPAVVAPDAVRADDGVEAVEDLRRAAWSRR